MKTGDFCSYAATVEYDGSSFSGFQEQKEDPTVQAQIQKAISTITGKKIVINFAGRTDAGVHALGQVISFSLPNIIKDERRFLYSLNSIMPASVSFRNITPVPETFHARFSCIAREYDYLFWNQDYRSAHWEKRAFWLRTPIPWRDLNEELKEITGSHDFAALTRPEHYDKGTIRYIDRVELLPVFHPLAQDGDLIALRIRGNAFLHNMIRILAGTIVDRTLKKIDRSLKDVVLSRDRLQAGQTAPPHALYFKNAYYPPIDNVQHLNFLKDFPIFKKSLYVSFDRLSTGFS